MTTRRFSAPWRADKIAGGYVIRDANGQALAYVYSRENEDEARQAKVLTKDEARRITMSLQVRPLVDQLINVPVDDGPWVKAKIASVRALNIRNTVFEVTAVEIAR
jgi:hypothetical protein